MHAKLGAAAGPRPAGRHAAAGQAALDRRRADPRAHAARRGHGSDVLPPVAAGISTTTCRTIPDVAAIDLIGGAAAPGPRRRSIRRAWPASGVTPGEVMQALQGANVAAPGRRVRRARNERVPRDASAPRSGPRRRWRTWWWPIAAARPSTCATWRRVVDGPAEAADYVTPRRTRPERREQAVTLAVAKRPGANATALAERVLARVDAGARRACCRRDVHGRRDPQLRRDGHARRRTSCPATSSSPRSRSRSSSGSPWAGARRWWCWSPCR